MKTRILKALDMDGMSRLGWFNFLFMQWFWLRLYFKRGVGGVIAEVGVLCLVIPLTGWWGNYYPKKPKELKLVSSTRIL